MRKQIFILMLMVFLVNLFWEVSHTSLYKCYQCGANITIHYYMFVLLRVTFTDAIIIGVIFLIITFTNKSFKWINRPSKKDFAIIIVLGLVIAGLIELYAIKTGRWAYESYMPTIFGIGLTPLIQLFTTAIVSLWLAKK